MSSVPALSWRDATDLIEDLNRLHVAGMPRGDQTGWPSVDKLYSVVPGQLTILTGWPGSGKSEWLDALMLNLAAKCGWRFCVFSPENQPVELHAAKMIAKASGKPFGHGPTERLTAEELIKYAVEVSDYFAFLTQSPDAQKTGFNVAEIIDAAERAFRVRGDWDGDHKLGLVIDPWNEIEHWRDRNISETEYISQTLSYVRGWAKHHKVHVWIVAHPQKLRRDDSGKLPIPRPDSISGSQNWWNKADNAITVHRALDDPQSRRVEIHVQKVRFSHVGQVGIADLNYDRVTGRYHELLVGVSGYAGRKG